MFIFITCRGVPKKKLILPRAIFLKFCMHHAIIDETILNATANAEQLVLGILMEVCHKTNKRNQRL